MPTPNLSWPHADYEPRLEFSDSDQTWRAYIRRRNSGDDWTSFEPNRPGYPTPEAALSAASTGVANLLVSQAESLAVSTVRLLKESRLRSIEVTEPGPAKGSITSTKWQARDTAGNWSDPVPSPEEATRRLQTKS